MNDRISKTAALQSCRSRMFGDYIIYKMVVYSNEHIEQQCTN